MIEIAFALGFTALVIAGIVYFTRNIKIEYHKCSGFNSLHRYNEEVSNGLVHTDEREAQMKQTQFIYDRVLDDYYNENMTRKECNKKWDNDYFRQLYGY